MFQDMHSANSLKAEVGARRRWFNNNSYNQKMFKQKDFSQKVCSTFRF